MAKKRAQPFDAATADIPESLQTPEFIRVWYQWVDYRKARKKAISRQAATMQLNRLSGYGPGVAIAAIARSIENDWQGVFPERESASAISAGNKGRQFSGLEEWAQRNTGDMNREYGT